MGTQSYQDLERWRVKVLELRRKIDELLFKFVEALEDETIQKIKGRNHTTTPVSGGPVRLLPIDDLSEDPIEPDKSGGPERRT